METGFTALTILFPIIFLFVQFYIYKSKFNKFAPSDTPNNIKLAIDIILLAVLGYISMLVLGFIISLLLTLIIVFISPMIGGFIGLLIPIFVLITYYFILKFLAGRHTHKENAKKIADQTLVFSILFGITYYVILTLLLIPFFF
ncbi:MAG: hypothetical protein GY828_07000 [Candidatus Gracilibacteria bacterium]|nr:hypothetical protein [Candidatus Gracilibacteria bacterium]